MSVFRRSPCRVAVAGFGLCLLLTAPRAVVAQSNTAPVITLQPANAIAGVGEDFLFTVAATGTAPLSFQWAKNGVNVAGETNSSLLLTNLTTASMGRYSALVTNTAGSTNSLVAQLIVQTNVQRRLVTGRVATNAAGTQAAVPINLRANGREHALSFSLQFNTNAFANPAFLAADTNATVVTNLTVPGTVGLSVTLGSNQTFPAGNHWIGLVQFDLIGGFGPLDGRLAFTTNPVAISAVNLASTPLGISAGVEPQFVLLTGVPQLNLQTGLFEHKMIFGNPGAVVMSNVDIFAYNFGVDSLTNAITFFNSFGLFSTLTLADPLLPVAPGCACGAALDVPGACDFAAYLACGSGADSSFDFTLTNGTLPFTQIANLQPGEARVATLEFYVSDHFTVPHPTYSLHLTDPLTRITPTNSTLLTITDSRYTNGLFFVEFPTTLGRFYFVQYAGTLTDLTNNPQTALPAISGTGSRVQWLDNGPPKTDSPPTNGSRFYRVFQAP